MANILVVDDEKEIVILMKFVLEKAGHRVATAANGAEAVKLLGVDPPDASAELPDLIVLDVMMPIMDGYTAAVMLRNDKRTSAIPILVVTAKSDMRSLFESLPSVAAFMPKPFDPKDLRELVAKALAGK